MLIRTLFLLFVIAACNANAQDTTRGLVRVVRRSATPGVPVKDSDTTRLVYDENGNLLHYYQYTKLVNTGEYVVKYKFGPSMPQPISPAAIPPDAKGYLTKISAEEAKRRYQVMKPVLFIKSNLLREGNLLDLTPFLKEFGKEEFANKKAIVLLFWESSCIQCVENFVSINDYFKQISNPNDIMVVAVSRDDERTIITRSLQKPLLLAHFVGGSVGQGIDDFYQLRTMPSYVVADKNLIIRFAMSGAAPVAMPVFKDNIKQLLAN